MFSEILNTITPALPTARIACFATAGILLGHKVVLAAGCKAGAVYAEKMGQSNIEEWNQASNKYLTQIKKDGVRDLTLATAIAGLGLAAGYTGVEQKDKIKEMLSNPAIGAIVGRSVLVFFLYKQSPGLGLLGAAVGALLFYRGE